MSIKNSAGYKAFMSQPKWLIGVEIAFGIGVTYIAAKGIWKFVKGKLDASKSQKVVNDFKDDLKSLDKKGIQPSFSDAQYRAWADGLVDQYSGCDFSTPVSIFPGLDLSYSGEKLYEIISNFKNDADFAKFTTAWGVRTYDKCGIFNGDMENVTIYAATSDELTNDEIATINAKLTAQGITYKF